MKKLEELLKGYFIFKEWSSHPLLPKQFSTQLNTFMHIGIYKNIREFLLYHGDSILTNDKGEELNINDIFESEDSFDMFIENNLRLSDFTELNYGDIHKAIIYGQVLDSTEPKDFFELVDNVETTHDFLSFVNNILSDGQTVTHSTGVTHKYEVIKVDSFVNNILSDG